MRSSRPGFTVRAFVGNELTTQELINQDGIAITSLEAAHEAMTISNAPKNAMRQIINQMLELSKLNHIDYDPSVLDYIMTELKNLPSNPVDYVATNPELGIAMCEVLNNNTTQENRIKAAPLAEFAELNENERREVLINTPTFLQDIIVKAKLNEKTGATLNAVIIVGREVYSLNLGNSTAFSCKFSNNNIQVNQLNEVTHLENRIKSILGVKESLGNMYYEFDSDGTEGVIHTPKLTKETVTLNADEKALVIVSCGGLTESVLVAFKTGGKLQEYEYFRPIALNLKNRSEQWIKNKLANIHTLSIDKIAEALAKEAISEHSTENISCSVIEINPAETTAKYAVIFDGNGGDEVAEAAYELFELALYYQMYLIKLRNISLPLANRIDTAVKSSFEFRTIDEISENLKTYNMFMISLNENYARWLPQTQADILSTAAQITQANLLRIDALNDDLNCRKKHFSSITKLDFLDNPIYKKRMHYHNIMADSETRFKNGAKPIELMRLLNNAFAPTTDLDSLYKVVAIILNIRPNYNRDMPSSFAGQKFEDFIDSNKKYINDLEQGVAKVFKEYSIDKSILTVINELKMVLIHCNLSSERVISFFGNSLNLNKAIEDINEIEYRLQKVMISNSFKVSLRN